VNGSLVIVGIGPGAAAHLTPAARQALETADVILGYHTYLDLIEDVAPGVPRLASSMRQEVSRVRKAIDLAAQGRRAAVVSGGDAGIYGMAGLVFEVLRACGVDDIPVEVIPGVSALSAAAALLGAPLMADFAVISLSDQLLPAEEILSRLQTATQAGFVLCLYNPKGKHRSGVFEQACQLLRRYRDADTPVGVVRAAYRHNQHVQLITLAQLPETAVDMVTLIVVGNCRTFVHSGKMVTPRGYAERWDLSE
jgi:precorrin-3B C17-methyltransferase